MANGAVANGARNTGGVASTSSTREKLNSDRQEVSSGLTTNDIISAVTFLDNPLNEYDNASYHIAFAMINPKDYQSLDVSKGIMIAETATTSVFNVTDLEITQNYAITVEGREGFVSEGYITVVDPYAIGLFDHLLASAAQLGLENFNVADVGYLLRVRFTGYDDEGNPTVSSDVLDKYDYTFPIRVLEIKLDITERGGQYRIKFAGMTTDSLSSTFGIIKEVQSIKGATAKEFIENSFKKINEEEEKKLYKTKLFPDIYEVRFKLDEFINEDNLKWHRKQPELKAGTSTKSVDMKNEETDVTTTREGTHIMEIIRRAFSESVYGQQLIKEDKKRSAKSATSGTDTNEESASQITMWWRIDTDVEYLEFDPLSNQYQRKITYYIYAWKSDLYSRDDLENMANSPELVKGRILKYAQASLKKRYDYYYTGLNTEILSLKLNFQALYYMLATIYNEQSPNGLYQQGKRTHKTPSEGYVDPLYQKIGEIQKLRAENSQIAKDQSALDPKEDSSEKRKLEDRKKENNRRIEELQRDLKSSNAAAAIAQAQKDRSAQIQQLASVSGKTMEIAGPKGTETRIFAEDLQFGELPPFIPRFMEDDRPPEQKQSLESGRDKSLWSTTQQNIDDKARGSDLFKINMEIRGDPYWLGVPGYLMRERYKNLDAKTKPDDFADYYMGSTRFYLEVKAPKLPEGGDDTEIQEISERPSVVSAVYGVAKVKHKFKVGKYTQELEGYRDLAIHGKQMIDAMNKASAEKKEKDSPAKPPHNSQGGTTDEDGRLYGVSGLSGA